MCIRDRDLVAYLLTTKWGTRNWIQDVNYTRAGTPSGYQISNENDIHVSFCNSRCVLLSLCVHDFNISSSLLLSGITTYTHTHTKSLSYFSFSRKQSTSRFLSFLTTEGTLIYVFKAITWVWENTRKFKRVNCSYFTFVVLYRAVAYTQFERGEPENKQGTHSEVVTLPKQDVVCKCFKLFSLNV